MTFTRTLPVRFHQQDDTYYCGPACAQMVLEASGAGLLDQSFLDSEIQSQSPIESCWATAPDQFPDALNRNRSPQFPVSYGLTSVDSKDALGRKIAWCIHHHQTPAIVLVLGRAHWLVVHGFEASAEPASPDDTSYSIISLDYHDPTPVPASPPPPHSASDVCGSGGDHGFAAAHVHYSHWEYAYLYPVDSHSYWAGKYLTVCDSDPPPFRTGVQAARAQRSPGNQIIPWDRVGDLAIAGLKQNGLYERESWNETLAGTSPGKPILVQRLDNRDTFYYIVPMESNQRAIPALVCVDARFGDYQQAAQISDRSGNSLVNLIFDPNAILSSVFGRPIDLGRQGKMRVRPEACALYPMLVWQPCRESMSPYLPFHMVIAGNRRIYIRVDGRIFTKLNVNDHGI